MRKTGWELPEPALQAEYKVQAHSWKELPGQREGAGPEPKVCAAALLGAGWGGREGLGREEEPIPASPASPSTQWRLLSRSPGQLKWWGLPAALRHCRDV